MRQGSSVRGAIDTALVAAQLAAMRGVPLPDEPSVAPPRGLPEEYTDVVLDAMLLALSGRIFLDETRRDDARRRCCGRSGRTTSCCSRPRPSPVEEPSRPTPRSPGGTAPGAPPRACGRCAAGPSSSPSSPTLYEPARGGGGLALSSGDRRRARTGPARPGRHGARARRTSRPS